MIDSTAEVMKRKSTVAPVVGADMYEQINNIESEQLIIVDTLGGFDKFYRSWVLDKLNEKSVTIIWEQIVINEVKKQYPNLKFIFDAEFHNDYFLKDRLDIRSKIKVKNDLKSVNFVTCFNHSGFIGRQFLTSAVYKAGWWNPNYCSKHFIIARDKVDGSIQNFCENPIDERWYRKFILDESTSADYFYNNKFTIQPAVNQVGRLGNLLELSVRMNESFVSIISETASESYQPYFTEKFLYPVITKNLWVAYAQPNYHKLMEQYYGFKKFNKIFDYSFDSITDPVARVVALIDMLRKFEKLSVDDWADLYLMELDTINYNYDQYFSGDYLKNLKKFEYGC